MFLNNLISKLITSLIFILFIFSCTIKNDSSKKRTTIQSSNITAYLDSSKIKTLNITAKKHYLKKAYKQTIGILNDSIKKYHLLKISSQAKKLKDLPFFKSTNDEAYILSKKLNDTLSIAKSHWNNGLYFSKKEALDSSFYHYHQAHNYYRLVKHENNSGKMLYGMAIIQSRLEDFIGCEINIVKAISKFRKTENHKSLFMCYSLLGVIYKEIGDYENAIKNHNKALSHLVHLNNKKTYLEGVYNNIAITYQKQNNYKVAITYLKKALNTDRLYDKSPHKYATFKDNLAYARLLNGDTLNVKEDLLTSLKIRISLDDKAGIIINKLHLAEYYLKMKDTIKSLSLAKNANILAINTSNNRDILASLLLLSDIDTHNSILHYKKYIQLNKKLQYKERDLRNKFARIRFETDEYKEDADKENSEKILIAVISTTIIIILLLLYFVRYQRGKNRELALESEQQRANENIYNLLLQQQAKLEEGRLNERHRISEELHDGLLGKIFATRMRLDFLDIEGNTVIQDKYQLYLSELQDIEKEMRVISHELKNELLSSKTDYTQIVQHLITEQTTIAGFKYVFNVDDTVHWSLITDLVKINCYRVIQEAIQNITKYAQATTISIHFSVNKNTLQLLIKDNGVGFDTTKSKKGIGLKNIAARIKKLKGTFALTSSAEEGTLLTIRIPINELNIYNSTSN